MKEFTLSDVETALCVWEAMCDNRDRPWWRDLFNSVGTWEMRSAAIFVAPKIDHEWTQASVCGVYEDAFDWEFIPDVLQELVVCQRVRPWEATQEDVAQAVETVVNKFVEREEKRKENTND